jgi:carbon monoxide dehydrogenase subunit G
MHQPCCDAAGRWSRERSWEMMEAMRRTHYSRLWGRAIEITGEFVVTAPPAAVWGVLMDPDTICRLATSCEEARQIDATHYEGTVRVRLGLLTVHAGIRGEVREASRPSRMTVALEGETRGLPGTFRGIVRIVMSDVGGETHGRYSFDLSILGRLGALGRPMLQMTAQRMANAFAGKMSRHLVGKG